MPLRQQESILINPHCLHHSPEQTEKGREVLPTWVGIVNSFSWESLTALSGEACAVPSRNTSTICGSKSSLGFWSRKTTGRIIRGFSRESRVWPTSLLDPWIHYWLRKQKEKIEFSVFYARWELHKIISSSWLNFVFLMNHITNWSQS